MSTAAVIQHTKPLTPEELDTRLARGQMVLRVDYPDLADAVATVRHRYTTGRAGIGRRRCQVQTHRAQIRELGEKLSLYRLRTDDLRARLREARAEATRSRVGAFCCGALFVAGVLAATALLGDVSFRPVLP